MNLTIDQGNSRTKVALFDEKGNLLKHIIYRVFTSADVEKLFSLYPIESSIISSVTNVDPAVINTLARRSQKFILFDHNTPVPIHNCYDTPHTLGQDRLAAAVGAVSLCPDTNLLIIDVGSAITYDFVSSKKEFQGGNIAPGIKMRFSVLHQMAERLPLVDVDENELIPLFGKNTRDAIAAGVLRGITYETKGYMKTLRDRAGDYQTFFTGGNAPYVINNLHSQQIRYEKHLVLIGLNIILEFNKKH